MLETLIILNFVEERERMFGKEYEENIWDSQYSVL